MLSHGRLEEEKHGTQADSLQQRQQGCTISHLEYKPKHAPQNPNHLV